MSYYIYTHNIVWGSSSGIVDNVLDSYPYGREFNINIGRGSLSKLRQYHLPRDLENLSTASFQNHKKSMATKH